MNSGFAPQNSFLQACTAFLWRAAKNKIGFIVCKGHVVWFSCADPGAGREQDRALRWLCGGPRGVSGMGFTSSQGFTECQVLLGDTEVWLSCPCVVVD